jgi:hypothetical protein
MFRFERFLGKAAKSLLVLHFLVGMYFGPPPLYARDGPPPTPRMAVLVVFDQMRGDYLLRWQKLFAGDGGFGRLLEEGAWFRNAHLPYAGTFTAAGHASLVTGCDPAQHGIIGNDWFDRLAGKRLPAVAYGNYRPIVPAVQETANLFSEEETLGISPERLLAQTVSDVLKATTRGQGRVVSLALKDRVAVLMGGKRPDACYWLDLTTGLFTTSSFYAQIDHPWVARFNHERPMERYFDCSWERCRSDVNYDHQAGPDDVRGEGYKKVGLGTTFPHRLNGGLQRLWGRFLNAKGKPEETGALFYEAVAVSPFGNELLLDLAVRALQEEKLGCRPENNTVPDLLLLGFSSNDLVGHSFGPDSQEVLDITLRSSEIIRKLLAVLDKQVGQGNYVLIVTADHGLGPLPEVVRTGQGRYVPAARGSAPGDASETHFTPSGRIVPKEWKKRVEAALNRNWPGWADRISASPGSRPAEWTLGLPEDQWLYLNQELIRAAGLEPTEVEQVLARELRTFSEVLTAYTRTQIKQGLPAGDAIGKRLRRSFHPERSGDVAFILRPYFFLWDSKTGTSHGTPYPYDTHVPLVVFGPGIKPAWHDEPISPQATAALLTRLLRLPPPASAEVPIPPGLLQSSNGF